MCTVEYNSFELIFSIFQLYNIFKLRTMSFIIMIMNLKLHFESGIPIPQVSLKV